MASLTRRAVFICPSGDLNGTPMDSSSEVILVNFSFVGSVVCLLFHVCFWGKYLWHGFGDLPIRVLKTARRKHQTIKCIDLVRGGQIQDVAAGRELTQSKLV